MAKETRSFPGVIESLEPIRGFVEQQAAPTGLSKKAIFNLKLAVDEIATNIILYGYEKAGIAGEVILTGEVSAEALTIVIEDAAAPFNPLERDLPDEDILTAPLEERGIGGLGIFLTVNGVDDFSYEYADGKNRNTFVMRIA